MLSLLVIGFLIKIYSRKPLYTYIKEKHGIETLRLCRGFEKNIIQHEKILCDLRYLLACKKDGLVPIFARPKLSIPVGDRTRRDVAKLIIKTELKNKHKLRNKLRCGIVEKSRKIRETVGFLRIQRIEVQDPNEGVLAKVKMVRRSQSEVGKTSRR